MGADSLLQPATAPGGEGSAAPIAQALVEARREARPLRGFPGPLPSNLAEAYAVQEAALSRADRPLGGWKVAAIAPVFRAHYQAERLAGPIFADAVFEAADGEQITAEVFEGGFHAIEAEFALRLTADLPVRALLQPELEAVAQLHIGAEIASSPLATINELGPGAVISDHGNNGAAVLGPEIPRDLWGDWGALTSRTFIDGTLVGEGSAARVAGGPFAALAFLTAQLASRGRSLKRGDIVLTGMTTGVHSMAIGSEARLDFSGQGAFSVRFAPRRPRS